MFCTQIFFIDNFIATIYLIFLVAKHLENMKS